MKRNENKKSLTKKIVAGTGLALLLALVGYTGANTYAKYITNSETVSQTATVAKWGVVVTASANSTVDGFSKHYKANAAQTSADGADVSASADQLIVAPGTSGTFAITVSGQPEVDSKLTISLSGTDVHYATYYPIKWDFCKDGVVISTSKSLSDIVNQMSTIGVYTYNANDVLDANYELKWSWAFENTEANANEYDTYLGNRVAGTGEQLHPGMRRSVLRFCDGGDPAAGAGDVRRQASHPLAG